MNADACKICPTLLGLVFVLRCVSGIASKVRVYRAGQVGQAKALLGYDEIRTGVGFCSGQEAVAHFGLGNATKCDVEVTLPQGRGKVKKLGVRADQLLLVHER
jgi:hypothetical protein